MNKFIVTCINLLLIFLMSTITPKEIRQLCPDYMYYYKLYRFIDIAMRYRYKGIDIDN